MTSDSVFILGNLCQTLTLSIVKYLKATLGSDNLIIFKCFRVKKENFRSICILNKKEPHSGQFATCQQNAVFEFLMSQTGQMAFPIFKVIKR